MIIIQLHQLSYNSENNAFNVITTPMQIVVIHMDIIAHAITTTIMRIHYQDSR